VEERCDSGVLVPAVLDNQGRDREQVGDVRNALALPALEGVDLGRETEGIGEAGS